ncbi:zinc finger protein 583-like isoform X2 [Galleria mellonella]|uniref:Zinc finger protein 583-like isoform X2 n=1 Tax=Galleria mellonella TaxID=7137 RepID=A0ABM3MZB3_GALME|nr:zinc finger protein 583-like isoform X2 [Galleria mellonella]
MDNEPEQIFVLNSSENVPLATTQKETPATQVNLEDVLDFSTVCRTCATITEFVIPIFQGEGLQNNLAEKIHKYLPIKVSEEDELPVVVCYQCASTLLACHELAQCSRHAETALRARLPHLPRRAPPPPPPPPLAVQQNTDVEPSQTNENVEKNQPETKWQACWSNFASGSRNTEPYMSEFSEIPLDIKFEINSDHDRQSFDEDDEPLSSIAATRKTDRYNEFYRALVNFRDHFVAEHGSTECNYPDFTDSSDSEAPDGEPDAADLDIDRFDDLTERNMRKDRMDDETRRELARARTRIDGKTYYACPVCGKRLSSPHTYVFHKRIHTGERPCVCHVCGKQFRTPNGLQRHVTETHERVRRHPCRYCPKNFANSQNLKQHVRTHTGERPYACAQCGKRFTQSGSLHAHRHTHAAHFPHACPDCGARFRLRAGLARHRLRHSGERPHACRACGRAYRARHELAAHLLAHQDARPHACRLCGAAFRQRRALRHHAARLHPPPPPPVPPAPPAPPLYQ